VHVVLSLGVNAWFLVNPLLMGANGVSPVRIAIHWRHASGTQSVEMKNCLAHRCSGG
jgi:hypothetical protein